MRVRIDRDREGRYSCTYLDGDVAVVEEPDGTVSLVIDEIQFGPGAGLSQEMAINFVQGWALDRLDRDELFLTRYDRVLRDS